MAIYAVLGCGGFVGSHLLDILLADPDTEVIGWDLHAEKIATHLLNPRFTFHEGDLYESPALERGIARADAVIALAALCNPSLYNTRAVEVIESNFIRPRLIANLCARLGKWLVQFSTSEVYGQTLAHWSGEPEDGRASLHELDEETSPYLLGPLSAQRWSYASAKQLLERYLQALHREHGLAYTVIRPFNFLGPRMDFLPGPGEDHLPRVLACFTGALLERKPLQLVDGGHARRTFLAVQEAVDAVRLMLETPGMARNKVFNLGNPANETTIRDLAILMRETAAELSGDPSYLEIPLVDIPALEFYGEGYADSDRRMPRIDRARRLLGWEPRAGLRDILRGTLAAGFARIDRSRPDSIVDASAPT